MLVTVPVLGRSIGTARYVGLSVKGDLISACFTHLLEKEYSEALIQFEKCRAIQMQILGEQDPDTGT